jgi:hypothetical protein
MPLSLWSNSSSLQEPEKAVNAFVSAMEYNPKDTELILRIARALVTTHDYSGGIDYFNKVCVMSVPLCVWACACV